MSNDQVFWVTLAGIGSVLLVVMVPILCQFWAAHLAETKVNEIKLEMVRQGYSVEDIVRVVQVSPKITAEADDPEGVTA